MTLKTATVGRYQTIGGWDVAYNKPKKTLRAVPAGSVYYFTSDANSEDIVKAFHWQNVTDQDHCNNAQIGFGLSLVGAWNYCKLS